MIRRYAGLSVTLTTIILLLIIFSGVSIFNVFHPSTLPLTIENVNAGTGKIMPFPGVPLPEGLHAGDHIDLMEQPLRTRIAIEMGEGNGQALPPEQVYHFVIQRGPARISIPVRTIGWDTIPGPGFRSTPWLLLFGNLFSAAIALAAIWRGRNLAAAGLALFAIANMVGNSVAWMPSQGVSGLVAFLGLWTLNLLQRAGLYVIAESMAGAGLSPGARRGWRASFLVLLGAAAMFAVVVPIVCVVTRREWAEFTGTPYGLILSASFLISVVLLFVGYHRARTADRARLRWMLWGGGLFAIGIVLADTNPLGPASFIAGMFTQDLALVVFLYAIVRHRVVDVRVVVSRTLVYAMTTSLVLGLFALFESLFERTALGHSASLVLELAVPLGLGVSLSTVHRRIDTLVDRLVFRRQYREETALRGFASESAFVNNPETLLDLTVEQIVHHARAPWVAFYEYGSKAYRRVCQRGEKDLPEAIATDDLALVKLRAHESDVDLHEAPSGVGREGYVFPLRARGHLLGVLVVGPRPDEHYAAEERELMAHVAQAVGASLFALRAQATEEQLAAARTESAARLDKALAEAAAQLEQVRAQGRVSEALLSDLRARESALLDALRALGADLRVDLTRFGTHPRV